jgi:hypothetical protein
MDRSWKQGAPSRGGAGGRALAARLDAVAQVLFARLRSPLSGPLK